MAVQQKNSPNNMGLARVRLITGEELMVDV